MLTPEQAVVVSILLCMAGAVLTLLVSRSKTVAGWLAFLVTAATAGLIFSAVAKVLMYGPSPHPAAFWAMPKLGFVLRIYVDGLTAWFLMLAALIAVPAFFYSIAYMRHYERYGVARYYPYFLLFLAAMYGLLSTTDMMWFFFIFWQLMTLPGYALIRFESRKPENVRAANKFLIMMQIACAATMVGAELLAVGGAAARGATNLKYDFDTVSASLPLLLSTRPLASAFAFALFLVGFGIKMGMWPFGQIWLPDAHPAAPSPVSAMLSGVMIKTGVYGLMRYFLWLVPISAQTDYPLARWGMLIAVLGTITLSTGTMQALKQEQSKRLLAFHSIGQVGYILLGTGACMALLPSASPATAVLATIGLFGALFHVLNHGLFKGLLFLNAGSMLHATGTQDLNKLGGLMKFMPLTAITALVASFSISGVPLFNGFVSKWSIYVAAIQGSAWARYLPVCALIAILTSALTLASFIKFFGVSFLSRTSLLVRSKAKSSRLEVPWMMQLPQLLLAFLCVLLGVVPAIGFSLMQRALDASRGGLGTTLAHAAPMISGPLAGVGELNAAALFKPLALAAVLGLMFLAAYAISKLGRAPRRAAAPWLCGYVREADCHRYVAHNFYSEIKRYFRWLGGMPRPRPVKTAATKELT
ncbi:MAG TPA: proton-conducting transporter membrane subunit [Terriglobales bacterium]|jgi:formate hydrogenlyase subunit 3/multisubunit Na+/H+ antiporter MnhD subunit|nr:proton-conducting transporter membrane subunit [Terriglobales bacterium]